uniref:Uncharacterized protein n=1 Tax=Opuntia streptacantha TaxID=393608 RepID=A0A7C9DMJ1_OPUST
MKYTSTNHNAIYVLNERKFLSISYLQRHLTLVKSACFQSSSTKDNTMPVHWSSSSRYKIVAGCKHSWQFHSRMQTLNSKIQTSEFRDEGEALFYCFCDIYFVQWRSLHIYIE